MSIRNKIVWLVGASSGIGASLTEALLEQGNFVYATAREDRKLAELSQRYPRSLKVIRADITDLDSMRVLESTLRTQTDVLDYVILSAGTCEYDDGPALDSALYRRVFDVNFFAQIACIRVALPMLIKSRGCIVGISSLSSLLPFPRAEAYGASKAAFEYFLNSLKIDLTDLHVGVTIVRPGFVDTPLTQKNDFDMPFICDAQHAAKKILRGMASGRHEINFPWQLAWSLSFFRYFRTTWQKKIAVNFRKLHDV